MEYLDLDFTACESVEAPKEKHCFDFPVISFHSNENRTSIYGGFNKAARKELGSCRYMNVYSKGEYLVFAPTDERGEKTFKLLLGKPNECKFAATVLRRFGVAGKRYKLYKTNKGFVIKINEPIKEEDRRWESRF